MKKRQLVVLSFATLPLITETKAAITSHPHNLFKLYADTKQVVLPTYFVIICLLFAYRVNAITPKPNNNKEQRKMLSSFENGARILPAPFVAIDNSIISEWRQGLYGFFIRVAGTPFSFFSETAICKFALKSSASLKQLINRGNIKITGLKRLTYSSVISGIVALSFEPELCSD